MAFEYLHLHWDFSWPWLNLGNGFSEYTGWIQWYEYTGTFGGTLWIWIVNFLVFKSVLWILRFRESETTTGINLKIIARRNILPILVIAVPIAISVILGSLRTTINKGGGTQVVLVQPNVDPYLEKYSSGNESTVNTIKELATPALDENTDFLIAPETVLAEPVYLNNVPVDNATLALKQFLTDYPNLNYLGGAVIIDVFNDASQIKPQTNRTQDPSIFYDDYNSAMFFNATNNVELYHKSKLVVGVENFPYKSLLQPILGDAMIDLGGTVSTKTTQTERSVFTNDKGVSLAPIICYESVYGSYVSDYVTNGAQFLAIITNDAWWNDTQGHKQHLSIARLRAIENRKWVARSANTGISAIINPTGEIVESLGYDKKGIVKGNVYPNDTVTFYAKQGDYLARIAIFMGIAVLLVGLFRNNGLT
ncbi:MAG: apolipoprotein N-acyltransferase, partial [Nonlabens sp.]|nr:apolipoprotein N-acyltransferase [Nonlabens sp.]